MCIRDSPLLPLAIAAGGPDAGGYVFSTDGDPVGPPHAVLDRGDVAVSLGIGDEESAALELPFEVDWYGSSRGELTVGDNAVAFFDGDVTAAAGCPGSGDWSGVAAYWGELVTDDVRYAVVGQYPYRIACLLYTSRSPRDATLSRMPSSA